MRSLTMQRFLDALKAAFDASLQSESARDAVDRVFQAAIRPATAGTPVSEVLDVTQLFPEALAPLLPRKDALGDLARALADLAPDLVWTTRKVIGPTASPGFEWAHANSYLMGPGALEDRPDLWIGLSLMAPGTRYPDHDHAPEEVYLVLSPGEFWHDDKAWIAPGVGGTVHNRPGIRHAMRAADAPFLAIWVLPV